MGNKGRIKKKCKQVNMIEGKLKNDNIKPDACESLVSPRCKFVFLEMEKGEEDFFLNSSLQYLPT